LSGGTLQVNLIGTSSNAGALIDIGLSNSPVPEPATEGLAGAGSMLLLFWVRVRKRA